MRFEREKSDEMGAGKKRNIHFGFETEYNDISRISFTVSAKRYAKYVSPLLPPRTSLSL